MPGMKFDGNNSVEAFKCVEQLAKSLDKNAKKQRSNYTGSVVIPVKMDFTIGVWGISLYPSETTDGNDLGANWTDITKISEDKLKELIASSSKQNRGVTASVERKFKFKDGSIITASCKEEAIAKIVKSGAIGDFFKRLLHQETYLGQYLEKNKNKYDVCTRNIASLIMRFIDYDKAREHLNYKNFVIDFLATADKAAGIIKDVAEKTSSNDEKALLDFRYVVSKQLHRVYDWVDDNTNRAMDSNLTSKDCENFAKNALKEYGKK